MRQKNKNLAAEISKSILLKLAGRDFKIKTIETCKESQTYWT
jgi:hypothetical protein